LSPGRRTNRKNFRSCQRTIMFLLFLFLQSTKNLRLQLAYFQPSARRPQAGDRIWCIRRNEVRSKLLPTRFQETTRDCQPRHFFCEELFWDVKITQNQHWITHPATAHLRLDHPTSISSSTSCLSSSVVPASAKELVIAAIPFSTLVMT